MIRKPIFILSIAVGGFFFCTAVGGADTGDAETVGSPARGFKFLTEKAYLPADFDQATFDQIWQSWGEPLRSQAENASPDKRRRMAFERYGLTERPGDD